MKRKVLLIIGFIVSLFAVSCNNIGLGEAIDTESPVISITSPNVGAVIRDKFAIKGVYSDDGQIKSIKLNLENLETGDSKIYDATYSKDSYTFVVDTLAEGIKDGNYAANITITDTYGHSTQTSATYIIDNTAPVIILSRPESKKGSEAFDVFGQEFKIEGRAHDDNKFDIEIQIFDEKNEETPLLTKTLKNVNRSIGLTVLDAKTAIEEYEKVYGKISQDKNEDKRLYCKIIARDESKRYPASESDILPTDNIGNEISTYYLESEFEEVIRASYSATDLYKMINGTFDSTGRQIDESITENDVKKLLNENKIEVGQFSLNPANNPSFEVTNFNAPLKKDGTDFEGEDYKLTRGSSITIKVNSGLDGTYIPGKSLGVYVIECDKNGKINEGATPIWLVKPEIDKDGAEVKLTEEELNIRKLALETQMGVEKSKSYTFKSIELIPSKTGMMVGRNYLICVEGYDTNKSIVSNFNKDYGFYFAPKDSAPSLTLEEPVANTTYLKKDSKLKVKGFSVTEMGNPTIDIRVDGKVVKTLEKADLKITGNDDLSNTSSFEYEIPATDFDQTESKEYVISIVAEMDGKETVKEKTVSYDIDSPEILIQSVTPIVVKNEKNNLNKNAEVKGSITDLFTGLSENLKYFVYQDDVEKLSGPIQTPSNFTVNVDTTKLTDEKDVVIKIYSEDKAGNSFEAQETYFVNQSTDIPNVDPNDDTWKKDINTEKELQDSIAAGNKNNIFSSGGSIVVKCSDDDGIDTVIVKIKGKDDSKQEFKVNGYPLESLVTYTLPTQSGRNGVEVTVKDKFGVEETQVVWVQVTGTNPKVECSVTPEYFTDRTNVKEGTPNQITVTGISEGADPFTIEILDAEGNYSSTTIVDVNNDGSWKNWTHSFVPKKDDISIVRYKIIDQWGLFTEVEVPFKVDKVAPLVTIADMPSKEATEGDNFRFRGTASDEGSVVEKVELSFDDGKTWQEAIGTNNWSHTSIFVEESAFNTEGEKTLKVRVSDTAGNYSEIETKDFVFDKAAPTVAIEKYNGNTISGASIDIQEAFSLSGSSFDGYGIATLSLAQNKDGEEKSEIKNLTPTTDGSWTVENLPWRAENAEIQSGKYVYTLTATDKAGKTSETKVNVLIDKAAPRITIKNPDNSYLKTAAIDRDEFTFAGTTEEDPEESGVASYSYVIKPRGSAKPELNDVDWITVASSATNWSFIKKIGNDKEELKEGSWTLYVKAKDKAGNETLAADYVSVDFDVDKAAPVQSLSLDPVKENGIYDATFSIVGKIHDTHGVEKVDVKILNAKTNAVVHTYASVTNITATSEPTENNLLQEITVGSEGAIKTDGSYIVVVTTTDKVGKVTENEYSIMVDREAPTVEISSIGDGEVISGLTKIEGAASDAASGVDTSSGRYVIKYNADEVINAELTMQQNGTWIANVLENTLQAEGKYVIDVIVADKVNHRATKSLKVEYDKAVPQLKVTNPNGNSLVTKTDIQLGGKAWDSYGLKESGSVQIVVKDSSTGAVKRTYTPAVTVATSEPESDNWTQDIVVGENGLSDGSYTIEIKAVDKVGKDSTIIKKDLVIDTVIPTVDDYTVPGVDKTEGSNFKFEGRASDEGTGIEKIEISFDNGNTWKEAVGTVLWTYTCIFAEESAFESDGEKTVSIRAIDGAGNVSVIKTKNFVFDRARPEGKIKTSSGTEITESSVFEADKFSLIVEGKDSYQVSKLILKQVTENGEKTVEKIVSGAEVSCVIEDLPMRNNNEPVTTGKYDYTLTVIDKAGKGTTVKATVVVDKSAPVVEIKTPDSSYEGVSAISNNEYVFTGTATENGTYESGVDSYSYLLKAKNVAPTENDVWINSSTGTNWTFTKVIGNEDGQLNEGKYTLYVKAKDKAGNESPYVSRNFDVDKAAPVQSLSLDPIKKNNIYDDTFSIVGKIYDTHGVEKVDVKIKNAKTNEVVHTYASVTNITATSAPTENNLLQEITVGSEGVIKTDGSYIVVVTTTDKVGKTSEDTYQITIDRDMPTVNITSHGENNEIESLTLISGTASDTGSGVSSSGGTLVIKQGNIDVYIGTLEINESNGNWNARVPNSVFESESRQEGPYEISVTIKDKVDHYATAKRTVIYDKAVPQLKVTSPNGNSLVTKTDIQLGGKAWDSYGLKESGSVQIVVKDSTGAVKRTYTPEVTVATSEPESDNWSQTIKLAASGTAGQTGYESALTDGMYTIEIKAIDKVGKISNPVVTKSVQIDTIAPTVSVKDEDMPTTLQTEGTNFNFKGTASDENGSEVKKVEISFDNQNWQQAVGTDSWSYRSIFAEESAFETEGTKTLYVKATDNAGNVSSSCEKTFTFDKAYPVGKIKDSSGSDKTNSPFFEGGEFSLILEGTDSYGVSSMKLIQKNGEDKEEKTLDISAGTVKTVSGLPWRNTNAEVQTGAYEYSLVITDKAGKTTTVSTTVSIDKSAPVVGITNPLATDVGLNSISGTSCLFKGTATDEGDGQSGVESYSYVIKTQGDPVESSDTWTETNSGSTNWSFAKEIGKDKELAEGKYTLYVKATDKAGNESTVASRNFDIDTANPVVSDIALSSSNGTNTYDANFKVVGKIHDTHGVDTVTISILKASDNSPVGESWNAAEITANSAPESNNLDEEISVGKNGRITADGKYVVKVSVKDKVGKETVVTKNVTVDSDAPTVQIAPYGTLNGHNNLINSLTFINGTASDAGSGIKTDSGKYVVKQGTTEIANGTLSIQANGDWSANIGNDLLSGKPDGEYTIEVTVSDLVGNDAHTAKQTLDVEYDKAVPQLEMSNASSITSGSDITLSGKVWDSYGLKESDSVEIVVKNASGTQVTLPDKPSVTKATTKPDADNWNQKIVVGSAGLSDGNYTIEIKAIDKVGKSSIEKTISVVIDTEAPTVEISNPDTTYVGTSAISGESFVFTGSVTDAKSGPESYKYIIKQRNADEPTLEEWTACSSTKTGTNWSFTKAIGNADGQLKEGEYTLYVKAMDNAENESEVEKRNFDVDKSAPVIKEIALSPSSTNNIYKETFNVKGKIYDTYGIEEVKVSVLNPNLTTSDANYVVSTPWSKDKTNLPTEIQNATSATLDTDNLNVPITIGSGNNIPTDGTYTIEVSVKDKMGKVTTSTKSVTIDTSGPTVTITNPAAEENGATVINGLTKIEGTSSDTGSGIDRTNGSYVIKKNGTSVKTGTLTIAATGNWSVTIPNNTLPTEGEYTIEVTVKDIVGNASKSSVNVEYDKEAPHVIASVDKTITKGNITVSGKAWDSYGLKESESVEIVVKDSTGAVKRTYTPTVTVATSEPESDNWSQKIKLAASGTEGQAGYESALPDGNYKVQIIAKDKVEKESIQTIDITVDKTVPTIDYVKVDEEKIGTIKHTYMDGETEIVVYNNKQIPIKVSANDNANDSTKGSGIKSVSYSTDKINYTELVFDKGTNTGNASVTCDWQGLGSIYIKVEDNAGNVSDPESNTAVTTVRIDTIAPEKPTSDITGTKLVNGKNDIPVKITAVDGSATSYKSGIAKVEIVKVGDNTITDISATTGTNNVYSLTIPQGKLSGGGVVVKVTDNAGNTTEDTIFTVTVDSENPTVKIADLIDAAPNTENTTQINGKITLTGTASDNYGIPTMSETEKPVKVSYKVDYADTETTDDTTFTEILGVGGTSTSWSLEIDTTTAFVRTGRPNPTKDDKITLKVEVTDTAKNSGSDEIEVYVDQDTDRPIINLSNLVIDGMTRGTPVWHKQKYLFGSVTDDDGTIKELYISTDGTNWGNNLFRNGSWQDVINDDGEKTLYFKVVDAAGTEFISNATTGAKPKLYDGENSITTDTNLYLKVDTTQPTIPNVWFRTTNPIPADKTTEAEIKAEFETQFEKPDDNDWEDSLPTIIGGPDSKLYVMYKAFDANGIHKTKVKCGTNEETETSEKYNVSTLTNQVRVVEFDISNLEDDENNKLVITAYDKATGDEEVGSYSRTFDLNVDNTKPEVSFGSLQNIYYGSESNSISGTMRDTNTISKLYLGLSKNDTEKPSEYLSVDYENRGQNTWTVTFDGGNPESTSLHTEVLNKWLDTLYGEGTQNNDAVKDVWLWAYAVDEMGNTSEVEKKQIKVSPQGDKPSVTIEVPAEGDSTGGSVRISGVADIQTSNIDSVWVQIDPSYDTSTGFDNNWKSELEPIITGVPYSIKENPQYEDESGNKKSISGINGNAAIKANGTSSWNLTINGSKEFQKEGENKTIAVRVYAVSKTGKVSEEAEVSFTIDPKSPRIGNTTPLQLVQYEADGTIKASMNYESGMWIKGKWFLIGSVEDESGISQIKYGDNKGEPVSIMGTDKVNEGDYRKGEVIKVTDVAAAASGAKNYMLKIPVGNDTENDFGRLEYYLNVVEGGTDGKDASQTIILNYDNQAPQFTAELDKIGNEIYQSDGTYSIKGTFDEKSSGVNNQSGFNRIVMFFERSYTKNDVTTKYLVDPMLEGGDSGTANRYPISEFVNKNNLYWRSSTADITDKGILLDSLPTNVRVGGLCMIKDVIYRIQTVREDVAITRKDDATGEDVTTIEDVITIDKPIVNQNDVTVYFALAQVIDNTTVESGLTKAYEAGSEDKEDDDHINGDGDQMIEGVQSTGGTEHKWSVGIDSSLIYDGPITIRFVAFDAAGNMTCDDFSGNVSNNAPRIAGVSFGTDNNGDGTISDGTDKNNDKIISANEINEMITAYSGWYNIESSNKQTGVTQNGKKANGQNVSVFNVGYREPGENEKEGKWETALVVKGNVMVKPEIVGGNTGLGYSVMQGNTTVKEYAHYEGVGHSSNGEVRDNDLTIELTVADFLSAYEENTDEVDGVKNFTFSIWDKTEGTTPGVNSQHADINIQMEVMLMDSEKPTVTIDPFYWESKDKNSLYGNSRENGHIELEDDLDKGIDDSDKNFTEASGQYDTDPKVSGKITIEGTAHDNVLLMELGVKTSKVFGTTKTFGSTEGYTPIAKRENGTWKSQGNFTNYGWEFEVVSETNLQKDIEETGEKAGNTLKWKLHLDTEKVENVAQTDFILYVQAIDRGSATLAGDNVTYATGNVSTQSDTQTTTEALTNFYKMDIVPYITEVQTSLSSAKEGNATVYSRTALGHYSVKDGESVTIRGFNLSKNAPSEITVTITSSGAYIVKCNNISSLNNDNNNDAKGEYGTEDETITGDADILENYYNRMANDDNNNLLTDDIFFDVWQFNTEAAKPISGAIADPVMKISPSGMIGFAFTNGPLYFSMPGTVAYNSREGNEQGEYSYFYWQGSYDFMGSIGLAYDSSGHTYGCAVGGDINSTDADRFSFMTDRWGVSGEATGGSYAGSNALRLEAIGQQGNKNGQNLGILNFDKNRIMSPSYATFRPNNNSTNIYLAYFDHLNGEIRFRYGNLSDGNDKKNFNNFIDDYRNNGVNNQNNLKNGQYSTDHVQVVANDQGEALGYAGEYVSIATTKEGYVVMVWYDSQNSNLMYSYNITPTAGTTGKNKTNWANASTLLTGAGEYCQIVVDSDNHIHIAAYDNIRGDLKYVYLSDYTGTNRRTCTVDSYLDLGENITLDVAKVGNNQIPHIGYWGAYPKKPRYAYLAKPELLTATAATDESDGYKDGDLDGTKTDKYTGVWECTIVPTTSKAIQDRVNVGVWKESNGTIKVSTTGTPFASEYYGKCYGNGTSNAVLGYVTAPNSTSGFIETAQMK